MPERRTREYTIPITARGNRIRMRITTARGELGEFVAQYETTVEEHSYSVVRCDNAHGRPIAIFLIGQAKQFTSIGCQTISRWEKH
jgi:hypothetical protein